MGAGAADGCTLISEDSNAQKHFSRIRFRCGGFVSIFLIVRYFLEGFFPILAVHFLFSVSFDERRQDGVRFRFFFFMVGVSGSFLLGGL